MTIATVADIVRPRAGQHTRLYDTTLIVGGSLLVTLSASIAIPLPFSPVPVTAQTMTVLLVGALLERLGRFGEAALELGQLLRL